MEKEPMPQATTATREATREAPAAGITLELEPEPVKPLARVEQPTSEAEALREQIKGSPLDKILQLKHFGITNEELREFLAMQREWEAEQARKAYHAAMAAFKREDIPDILKKHHVNYPVRSQDGGGAGEVDYWHEDLFAVVAAALEPMAKHGLTHKWVPSQSGNFPQMQITIRCVVTHELGHSDFVELHALPDTSGKKNPIQSVKSTISYLERITLLAITGLAAKGMDDDGRTSGADPTPETATPKPTGPQGKPATSAPQSRRADSGPSSGQNQSTGFASAKQVKMLETRCDVAGLRLRDLLDHFQIDDLARLPFGKVDEAVKWIKEAGGQ